MCSQTHKLFDFLLNWHNNDDFLSGPTAGPLRQPPVWFLLTLPLTSPMLPVPLQTNHPFPLLSRLSVFPISLSLSLAHTPPARFTSHRLSKLTICSTGFSLPGCAVLYLFWANHSCFMQPPCHVPSPSGPSGMLSVCLKCPHPFPAP